MEQQPQNHRNQNNVPPVSTPANTPLKSPQKKEGKHEILSTVAVLILAPLVALLLTMFVFQSYEVDGPSMESTLQDNDRLIVNKVGRTWAKITNEHYHPERYSIVVFTHKNSSLEGTEEKQLIKRVIGLPGDRVVIRNGEVTVYNDQNPDGYNVDKAGPEKNVVGYTDGNVDQTVKPGQVFVLGDNRKNSLDSRAFGTVDSDSIVGTLTARIYPFNQIEKF